MHRIKKILFVILLIMVGVVLTGCKPSYIKVEYLPDLFEAERLHNDDPVVIAFNALWDKRNDTTKVAEERNYFVQYGESYKKWATERQPTEILEEALILQLEKSGFQVVRTTGWNLSPDSIPPHIDTDYIIGGNLHTFWVESSNNLAGTKINARVMYDLVIADVKQGKILWAGQFTGSDEHNMQFFANVTRADALSRAFTSAVNQAFQERGVRDVLLKLVTIRF